jgi:hypothetical protein
MAGTQPRRASAAYPCGQAFRGALRALSEQDEKIGGPVGFNGGR